MAESRSNVPYDPLTEVPSSPRLPPDHEFGLPQPGFLNQDSRQGSRNSLADSTMNYRSSEYGSIAGLRPYSGLPPGAAAAASGYRDHPNGTKEHLPMTELHDSRGSYDIHEKNNIYAPPRQKSKRKMVLCAAIVGGLIVLVIAVAVPVYFFVIKPKSGNDNGSSNSNDNNTHHTGNDNSNQHQQEVITTGGDGSVVTKEDGTTFVYNNTFGGYWVDDPNNPLNNSARAQSWSPPLTEEWRWGVDQIYGVNIGGWLNLEPFISPAMYEQFGLDAVDEWTLSELLMQRDGNLNAIEEHYKTFITEEDFAQIAAAGLNWVRLPLPFWAIETYPGEPHLPKVSWQYFLKAIKWARKYGIRINLDFHAVPGSQNGWNHSGKLGQVNFLNGAMGFANAQRTLDYIRILAEFISQPEYRNVVPFFGILNEPRSGTGSFSQDAIASFYAEAYRIIRTAGGFGPGNGPVLSLHEAFQGLANWASYFPGGDRIALDSHPYLSFGGMSADPVEAFIPLPCNTWGSLFGESQNTFGLTAAGEWSHAINDCGLFLNAVGVGTRYEGTFETTNRIGSCDQWIEYENWDQHTKDSLRQFSLSTMDALQNWFFWTWKIGESSTNGKVQAPFWSYKLGLQEGWTPTDPRESAGQCARVGGTVNPYSGTLANNWAQGGTSNLDTYAWPPTTIGGGLTPANAAVYTATGPFITLPVPTSTESGATATPTYGDGWANDADQTPMAVPIAGCTYPDPWDALAAAVPACAIGNVAKRDVAPGPTPMA